MIFRMLLPWWAIALICVPLGALAIWQLAKAGPRLRWAWMRRTFMVLLTAAMLLCPAIPEPSDQKWTTSVEVYFVVDTTGSMAAQDFGENGDQPRLDGVRHDLDSITDGLPGSRYSVITFASDSIRTLPLTSDARAVKSLASTLTQEVSTRSTGSNVGRALPSLELALKTSFEERPENVRLVYFMSDGENTDNKQTESFAPIAQYIDGGAVMGYGTEDGGPMKIYLGEIPPNPDAGYIQDPKTGGDAISRIDEQNLKAIANQMGVTYTHRTQENATTELTSGVNSQLISADGRRPVMNYRDIIWPIGALLVILWLGELWYLATHLVAFRDDKARRIAPVHHAGEGIDPLSDDAEQVFVGETGTALGRQAR